MNGFTNCITIPKLGSLRLLCLSLRVVCFHRFHAKITSAFSCYCDYISQFPWNWSDNACINFCHGFKILIVKKTINSEQPPFSCHSQIIYQNLCRSLARWPMQPVAVLCSYVSVYLPKSGDGCRTIPDAMAVWQKWGDKKEREWGSYRFENLEILIWYAAHRSLQKRQSRSIFVEWRRIIESQVQSTIIY